MRPDDTSSRVGLLPGVLAFSRGVRARVPPGVSRSGTPLAPTWVGGVGMSGPAVCPIPSPLMGAHPAETLRDRLAWFSWYRAQLAQHPGGIIPKRDAARVLGVGPTRIKQLIREGRLPTITTPEHLGPVRVWIPVDALIGAPTPLEQGRPIEKRSGQGIPKRMKADRNQSYPTPARLQNLERNTRKMRPGEDSRNYSIDRDLSHYSPQRPIIHVM